MIDDPKLFELFEMCFYGHIVKRIINEGVDVNAKGLDGMTALSAAIQGENPEIVEYLISIGAK